MAQSRKPNAAYWDEVRRVVAYADFLCRGGDPRSFSGRELRHNAFGGPGPTLEAMHAELVDPKWRGRRSPHSTSKNRHTRRETPSARRRRLASDTLKQQRSSHS